MRSSVLLLLGLIFAAWSAPATAQPAPKNPPAPPASPSPEPAQPAEPLPPGEAPVDVAQPQTPPPGAAPPPVAQPGYAPPGYGPGYPPPPAYGQPYYGQPYYGQPYYGQPYYGQPYYGQPYHGQPYHGQPYHGQPYHGQPSYGQPYPPPPPPRPHRSARRHDGFYLRLGVGLAYGVGKSKSESDGVNFETTLTGLGPAYELLIGGTLGSGFVLGGGFVGQDIQDPEVSADVADRHYDELVVEGEGFGVVALGIFGEWFPDVEGGVHVGGLVGVGLIGLPDDDGESSGGIGGALWGGYDFWVGDQWSIGPEARIVAVSAERQVGGLTYQDTASSFELLFTALYH